MDIINRARKQLLRERINLNTKRVEKLKCDYENKSKKFLSNSALDKDEREIASVHITRTHESCFEKTKCRQVEKLNTLISRKNAGLQKPEDVDLSGTQLKRWVVNYSKRVLTEVETRIVYSICSFYREVLGLGPGHSRF